MQHLSLPVGLAEQVSDYFISFYSLEVYIVYLILFIALHAARASEIHDKGQERVLINEFLTL